jgi:hypothetical protein
MIENTSPVLRWTSSLLTWHAATKGTRNEARDRCLLLLDRTLSLEIPYDLGDCIFGGYRDQNMYMIRQ